MLLHWLMIIDVAFNNAMLYVNRDECDQLISKFVARKADLLFCKPDVLFKSENEDAHKRASMLYFQHSETITAQPFHRDSRDISTRLSTFAVLLSSISILDLMKTSFVCHNRSRQCGKYKPYL